MAKVVPSLVPFLCFSLLYLSASARPLLVDQLWVNGDDGVDNPTCGPAEAPCKTLNYVVGELYKRENQSYVEVSLQSNIIYEECGYGDASSSVIIVCK